MLHRRGKVLIRVIGDGRPRVSWVRRLKHALARNLIVMATRKIRRLPHCVVAQPAVAQQNLQTIDLKVLERTTVRLVRSALRAGQKFTPAATQNEPVR